MNTDESLVDRKYVVLPDGMKRWVRRRSPTRSYEFVYRDDQRNVYFANGSVVGEEFVFNRQVDHDLYLERVMRSMNRRRSFPLNNPFWVKERHVNRQHPADDRGVPVCDEYRSVKP